MPQISTSQDTIRLFYMFVYGVETSTDDLPVLSDVFEGKATFCIYKTFLER